MTDLHRDAQKPGTQVGQSYQQSPHCKVLSGRERPLLGFQPGSYRLRGDQSSRSFWKNPEESSCLWYGLCFLFLLEGWGIFPIFRRLPPSLLSWQKCILGGCFLVTVDSLLGGGFSFLFAGGCANYTFCCFLIKFLISMGFYNRKALVLGCRTKECKSSR